MDQDMARQRLTDRSIKRKPPATGQVHTLSVLGAPGGFAGIYVSLSPASILTPIGELLIDPTSFLTLIEAPPNSDNLLSMTIPVPSAPGLIGLRGGCA